MSFRNPKRKKNVSRMNLTNDKSAFSATNTVGSGTVGTYTVKQVQSLNDVVPSYENVERLFYEACTKVREGFVQKKYKVTLPEHLSDSSLPVESLAFDREVLILIADKMGVKLTNRMAIEAILVAEKLTTREKDEREKHQKVLESRLGS